jgi:uncharacterized Fe-S cluster-containing radical SAM superfamily protein
MAGKVKLCYIQFQGPNGPANRAMKILSQLIGAATSHRGRLALASLVHRVVIPMNRVRNRQHLSPRKMLFIETSSVCNFRCIICPYRKGLRQRKLMPLDLFESLVARAVDYGFTELQMSPTNGEVYADPEFSERLQFVESLEGVHNYIFTTNFSLATCKDIDFLFDAKKHVQLDISIYGHDRDSFLKISGASERHFEQLIDNLEYLVERGKNRMFPLLLALRTYKGIDPFRDRSIDNRYANLLRRLVDTFSARTYDLQAYSAWNGEISPEELSGVQMDLIPLRATHKEGACQRIFYTTQINVDGMVSACACRDLKGELTIGDLSKESFADIFSEGSLIRRLVERQERGDFPPICQTCDWYRSIYLPFDGLFSREHKHQASLNQHWAWHNEQARKPRR